MSKKNFTVTEEKVKILKVIVLLMTLFSVSCWAYDGTPKEQVNSFFNDYSKGDYERATTELFERKKMSSSQKQMLITMQQQLSAASNAFGEYIGNENIYYDELSPSLIRVVEIAKYEHHVLVWEFYFYKPKDEWINSEVTFKDSFTILDSKK